MQIKNDERFDKYVKNFKKLSTNTKKIETLNEMKKIFAFITMLQIKDGVPKEILFNREILDVNKKMITEDDFVEAMFVYTHMIQESFSEYVNYKEG